MSLDEFKNETEDSVVTPKKKMTLDKFLQQFNTLDPQAYGTWPISVKITCWLFIAFFVCALGYFLVIKPKMEEISSAETQEQSLLTEFQEKDSKFRNLSQYQKQLEEMQANFNQQLEQLPKETEIPGLVDDINRTGITAGLKLNNIRLEKELEQEFFIEQPISIEASGSYHAFGSFVSGIALLPRIVTLHDFEMTTSEDKDKKTEIPQIGYKIQAKTYRYVGMKNDDAKAEEPK